MNAIPAVFRRGSTFAVLPRSVRNQAVRAAALIGSLMVCLLAWTAPAQALPDLKVPITLLDVNLNNSGTISFRVCNNRVEAVTVTLVTYYVSEPSNSDLKSFPVDERITRTVSSQAVYDFETVKIAPGTCEEITVDFPKRCPLFEADIFEGPLIPILSGSDSPLYGSLFAPAGQGGAIIPVTSITAAQLQECNPVICTVTQGGYGAPPRGNNPATFLAANFPTGGVVFVGGDKNLTFTSSEAIRAFLPSGGTPGVLNESLTNPTKATGTSAGVFASQVLTLRLNVSFNPAFGALRLCNTGTSLDKITVAQILVIANNVLGGDLGALPAGYSLSALNDLVDKLNNSFDNCKPNGFAQKNLCR